MMQISRVEHVSTLPSIADFHISGCKRLHHMPLHRENRVGRASGRAFQDRAAFKAESSARACGRERCNNFNPYPQSYARKVTNFSHG
jgi:hypothetical protein